MKIFLGSFYQETNSFSPLPSDLALFRRQKLLEGPAMLDDVRGSNLELAGMLAEIAVQFPGAEIVPGLYAWSVASGPLTDDAFAALLERMLGPLRRALPVDAVMLSMHGSMGSASCHDCEGELLARIRALMGPDIPIAVSFDSHAAISAKILRAADVVTGYRTYPHVDMAETGRRITTLLARRLRNGRRAQVVTRRWQAVIPVDNAQTDSGPMAQLWASLCALESESGVLAVSAFGTHPWFDTPDYGLTLLAYTDPGVAGQVALKLEKILLTLWQRRGEFVLPCPDADEFFRRYSNWPAPIAAIDAGDITTAGAPGDSTVILRAALRASGPRVLLPIVARDAVGAASAIGEGRFGELIVGSSSDRSAYNARVTVRAQVTRISAVPVRLAGAAFGGMTLDLGARALFRVGAIEILAMQHGSLFHDPELWRSIGVEPAAAHVIVQKSHKLFRPAYAGIMRSTVTVETPGCTDRNLARLPYRHLHRPVFALDQSAPFTCTDVMEIAPSTPTIASSS